MTKIYWQNCREPQLKLKPKVKPELKPKLTLEIQLQLKLQLTLQLYQANQAVGDVT